MFLFSKLHNKNKLVKFMATFIEATVSTKLATPFFENLFMSVRNINFIYNNFSWSMW